MQSPESRSHSFRGSRRKIRSTWWFALICLLSISPLSTVFSGSTVLSGSPASSDLRTSLPWLFSSALAQGGSPPSGCCQLEGGSRDTNSNGVSDDLEIYRHLTPIFWQADEMSWNRDVDPKNKIDDLIDNDGPQSGATPLAQVVVFDVVVDYNRKLTQSDITFLESLGTVGHVSKYITSAFVSGVTRSKIEQIAAADGVVMVEKQMVFHPSLNTSVASICVIPGGCTGGDVHSDPLLSHLRGDGVNIVIMDTGVDNTGHEAFANTSVIAGYDALHKTFGDPDDAYNHGTHVASIALGSPWPELSTSMPRGIADRAGLIDVRIFEPESLDPNHNHPHITDTEVLVSALEAVLDNRGAWGVDVINMSFGDCHPETSLNCPTSDGRDMFSQLVDLTSSMGIVVVAAAGNSGPGNTGIPSPAAAGRAIAVAASNGQETATRSDDKIASFSQRGPRASDEDSDLLDELKPEVTGPGDDPDDVPLIPDGIRAAEAFTTNGVLEGRGTSMASPHVAGLAALIIQQRGTINAQSVKELIISTAQPKGSRDSNGWSRAWGYGLMDAHAALSLGTVTDIGFPSHPPDPVWMSPDISTTSRPKKGQMTTVEAVIENFESNWARKVSVKFGVSVYTASVPTFYDIGTKFVDIPPNSQIVVSMNWTPDHGSHQCLKVEVGYGADTDFSNNRAQRNLDVANSPVSFEVRNLFSETPEAITFVVTTNDPNSNWTLDIDQPTVILGADDGPLTITTLPRPPLGTPDGAQETFHIEARTACCSLGGVSILATMRDCNGNGVDDWEDIDAGTSVDGNGNGTPDECDLPQSPGGPQGTGTTSGQQ